MQHLVCRGQDFVIAQRILQCSGQGIVLLCWWSMHYFHLAFPLYTDGPHALYTGGPHALYTGGQHVSYTGD